MHPAGSAPGTGNPPVTQAQADTCCAVSERLPSTPSPSHFPVFTLVVVPTVGSFPLPESVPVRDAWRTPNPTFLSGVPRHLFLSVFLV